MSAALTHPVPTTTTARRPGVARPRLRAVPAPSGPGPVRRAPSTVSEPRRAAARRSARPVDAARPVGGPRQAPPRSGTARSGLVLVPLGELLVPVGRPHVLRPVRGGAVEVAGGAPGARPVGLEPRPATWRATGDAAAVTPLTRAPDGRSAGARGTRTGARPPAAGARRGAPVVRGAVFALVLLLAAAAVRVVGGPAAGAAAAAPSAEQRVVVVEEGQTLWALARELAPEADPRVVVEELRAANGLERAGLAVGQRLVLPPGR